MVQENRPSAQRPGARRAPRTIGGPQGHGGLPCDRGSESGVRQGITPSRDCVRRRVPGVRRVGLVAHRTEFPDGRGLGVRVLLPEIGAWFWAETAP
jgi:hypothetical protein